jgi:predicted enzyme related to lactoylglutathione lyase
MNGYTARMDRADGRGYAYRHDGRRQASLGSPHSRFTAGRRAMEWKLELVVLPVSDMDRAKSFYSDKIGFNVDVDHRAGETFRVIQVTPPGSSCSVTLMRNEAAAGSVQGLHLIVSDIEAARSELADRGAEISDFFHFDSGGQVAGLDPNRASYGSYFSFTDPDGNGWLVQEVPDQAPGS